MKKRLLLVSSVLASAAIFAFAAGGIDGKWTAETQGKNGAVTQTLVIKSSGMNLTGTLDNGRGGMPVAISEGMLHDSDVTFKVTTMGRDGTPQVTTYKGTVAGDELKLTPTREGGGGGGGGAKGGGGGGGGGRGPQEMTFKRAQ